MAGTKAGGIKTRSINYEKHGKDFYRRIGSIGGKNGHTGGFAYNHDLAKTAGAKGGAISKRCKVKFTKRELIILKHHLLDEGMFGKIVHAQCYRHPDGHDRAIFVSKDKQLDITIATVKGCKYKEMTDQLREYFIYGKSVQ